MRTFKDYLQAAHKATCDGQFRSDKTAAHLALEAVGFERLIGALASIAQYDPRWPGGHVNDEPSRAELIARAFDGLSVESGAS